MISRIDKARMDSSSLDGLVEVGSREGGLEHQDGRWREWVDVTRMMSVLARALLVSSPGMIDTGAGMDAKGRTARAAELC